MRSGRAREIPRYRPFQELISIASGRPHKIEIAILDALIFETNLSDLRTCLSVILPVPADNATRMHILHLYGVPDRRF